MSTVAISQLPVATTINPADEIPIVQSGITKKITNALFFSTTSLASATGLPIVAGTTGTLSVARGGTGVTTASGSGSVVLSVAPSLTAPNLITPTLGVAVATSINKVTITAPPSNATLTIAEGKTLTANHSLTLAGTDATTMTFPSTSASIARTDAAQTFTGTQTFSGPVVETAQVLFGPGAVNITQPVTAFTSTAAGNALTLADGVAGQLKTIVYVAETAGGDTGVLTPTNLGAGSTITFNAVGDACILQFIGTDWWAISLRGAVLA
jgi:hypothetical protein